MKQLFKFVVLFVGFSCMGCKLFSNNSVPYLIEGEMVIDSSSNYEIAGLNFSFINKSEKNVKDFTIVFYVFDQDGNPPDLGRNNLVITVSSPVKAWESLCGCISLDSFMFEIPDEPYTVDYLYVSQINYEDDSVWSDPFGLCFF